MRIEDRQDADFINNFLEIDGFLYKVTANPTDMCAARLDSVKGISGVWHLFNVVNLKDNDLHLQYEGIDVHVSYTWFTDNHRLYFINKVTKTSDGLFMPDIKIPDRLNDLNEVYKWLFALYECEMVFDKDYWSILSDLHKAVVICYISVDFDLVESMIDKIENDILPGEKDKSYPVIYALLCYLLSGAYDVAEKKDYYVKEAHNKLLHAITDSVLNNDDISKVLSYILPSCRFLSGPCDAYLKKEKQNYASHLSCHCQTRASDYYAPCSDAKEAKTIGEFLSKHKKYVEEHLALPNLSDLICNMHIDTRVFAKNNRDKLSGDEYTYVIAGYVLRAKEIAEYLKCDYCKGKLYPDLFQEIYSDAYSITTFSCENYSGNEGDKHDESIYINHCIRCYGIIDSRECKHQENEYTENGAGKMWLCMRCGGSRYIARGTRCPSCGKALNDEQSETRYIVQCDCGHNGSLFGKEPRPEARRH